MVGRELLTACPDGEDRQGHIWGDNRGGVWASGWMVLCDLRR